MSPRAGWLLGALLAATPAAAATDYAPLRLLMSCLGEPAPTAVLGAMTGDGTLGTRTGPGEDDDYCWALAPPLAWDGMSFSALCVVTDEAGEIAAHPEFYWAGAMAPWTEVWLVSAAPKDELLAWARATLPAGSRFEIDPPGAATGSALSCSEWRFPLPG